MTKRLLAATLGPTIVLLVVLVIPFGLTFAERERNDLLSGIERDAVAIGFFVEDELDPTSPDVGIDLPAVAERYEARTGGRLVILDGRGIALADSDPPGGGDGVGRDFASRPEIATALGGEVARGERRSETLGGGLMFVAIPVASGGEIHGALRITYPTAEVDDRIQDHWLMLAGLSGITVVIATAVAVLLATSVTRPLRRLQHAAARLGSGELTARAPTAEGPPEVRDVASTFNQMAAQLEELLVAQDQFVADASHELRTPLTALKLRLEMLDGESEVDAAVGEVDRMARVVDGLLALARADRPDPSPRTDVDLAAFLEDRRDAWEPLASDSGVELVVEASGRPTVSASADRLTQIVDNLVANAIEAAPTGSTVRLVAASEPATEIHVIDAGPGLSDEDRARAFDRFWRSTANPRRGGGSGIGLAIVRKLAIVEGAEVELRRAASGGIDAVVGFPRAPRP